LFHRWFIIRRGLVLSIGFDLVFDFVLVVLQS
jgi:hypothetical protein